MPIFPLVVMRIAVGLLQGIVLYLLYRATVTKTWPATDGLWFASIQTVAMFVPIVILGGLGNLRSRALAIWTVAAVVLCAATSAYDIYRDPVAAAFNTAAPRFAASAALWFCLAAITFIVHAMIAAGEADRKFIASYPQYLACPGSTAQLVLAVLFAAVFWGLLWLGAELFRLIRLEYLAELIKQPWFSFPATMTAFAYAIHITDIRANLVTGARTLKLTLLSWLLPMMTAFAVVFLLALPFAGLEPLWNTRRATGILLTSVAALVFLINAAYQDGQPETPIASVLRQSRWIAALVTVPLVALAGYGLLLRVQQYGWTPQRIFALAGVVVASCYAAGYGFAAIRARLTFKPIESTNVLPACVIVAVLLALFSPLADPARISAADQVSRLKSGQTPPEKLDTTFLRFGAGRAGVAELERLAKDAPTPQIAERAQQALQTTSRYQMQLAGRLPATPERRAANITLIPAGRSSDKVLPDSFVTHNWNAFERSWVLPRCLIAADAKCEALLVDMDGDGKDEIVLLNAPNGTGSVFKSENDGSWSLMGAVNHVTCPGVRDALRAGQFEIVASPLKEIEVSGQRIGVINNECKPPAPR